MSLKAGEKIIAKKKTEVLVFINTDEKNKFYVEEVNKNTKGEVLEDCALYMFTAWSKAGGKRKDPLIVGDIVLKNGTRVGGINGPDWKVVE
tara:strand:- start:1611 stop:1883 length:273 start_codon:yes stop_codon:yes gene_type:complete